MTKNTVVIPLDGSDYSIRILATVQKFLPPEQNRLILLRVCKDSRGFVSAPRTPSAVETNIGMYASHADAVRALHPIYATQIQESQRAEVMTELQDTLRGLQTLGYEVTLEVTYGEAAEEIVNFVTLTDVDLVAMTTHGRTGLSKVLSGNVAEHLIRHAGVPVLLLRPFKQ
ncbi:MAG: universal stress protein [Caldilineaceae bacterium]|nr:universal stress protein [Caldilineaceae bacterium]